MNFRLATFLLLSTVFFPLNAEPQLSEIGQPQLNYYLPQSAQYDPTIPTPESVLGYQVGEWHIRPEQIAEYFEKLAAASPRVKVETIGRTYEQRPLILAYFSVPENIQNLEDTRQKHLNFSKQEKRPLVSWMGYSVHGNEASGSNAALLFAYHLAAAKDTETLAWLKDQVVIIDPMINPDGLARFAHWVNMYRAREPLADSKSIEHNEAWPRGRTNHYWFDLNRDWLLLQHPESRARIRQFHRWKPNVLTDFHEMGTNSTYFFQPGVKSRQNPLTPDLNFELTAEIAKFHAKALDSIGSLYYSKEGFDDFYYGKGSTYPDVNGAIGILFEQASSRGHLQESVNGDLSFPFAIRNHLTTSFSTLRAAQSLKSRLLRYQSGFTQQSLKLARNDRQKAVLVSSRDSWRLAQLAQLLRQHQISVYQPAKEISVNRQQFQPDQSLIIPLEQPQYRLIKSLFEDRTTFKDETFYDVSAWNLARAFDLNFVHLDRSDYSGKLLGKSPAFKSEIFEPIESADLALAFDWHHFDSARLLAEMQKQDWRVHLMTKPQTLLTDQGQQTLPAGTIVLPLDNQTFSRESLFKWLAPRLKQSGLRATKIRSGLAVKGVDLGSPSNPVLPRVKPLLLIGDGVSSYEAGEVWHLMDQRLHQPLAMMSVGQLSRLSYIPYTHIILVNGSYDIQGRTKSMLDSWLRAGGVLIGQRGGAKWLIDNGYSSAKVAEIKPSKDLSLSYAERSKQNAKNIIGGAIAAVQIDAGHPFAYGLDNGHIAFFKQGQLAFTEPAENWAQVAHFESKVLQAGYMSKSNQDFLANKSSLLIQGMGKGKVIAFSDNPNFRAFWLGSSRIFVNALYFSPVTFAPQISKAVAEQTKDKAEKSVGKNKK